MTSLSGLVGQDSWDSIQPTICLAIPGLWPNREALMRVLARESEGRFILFGDSIMSPADLRSHPFDMIEHDPLLAESIRQSGAGHVPEDDLTLISRHTFTLYMRGEGGSIDAARRLSDVAGALVRAGGLAVKVESSGVSHARNNWLKRGDADTPSGLYWNFVALHHAGDDRVYSCGMQHFGLRDAITSILWDPQRLATLLHSFLGMTFSGVEVADGQRFNDTSGVQYSIHAQPCTTFPSGHMQFNPLGMWRLELLEQ